MKLSGLLRNFLESEKTAGFILVAVTIISLLLANSSWQANYVGFWQKEIAGHSITHWINDGLMAIFFLMIGLELKREIYTGELSGIKKASLPVVAAAGGMLVPGLIFFLFNAGTNTQNGFGIPMATDIAFAIGILSLLGKKSPPSLKIFLTALAVIDDLGAIILIAVFYTTDLSIVNLLISLGVWTLLLILNKLKMHSLLPYLLGGIVMWYFMLQSGVHATIAGVLLAFVIPFGKGSERSASYLLQKQLHKPVAFVILPLFALANTCIPVESGWYNNLSEPLSQGIMIGLIIGKPVGIILSVLLGVGLGICVLPKDIRWKQIAGAGMLGGIGFTMSIFISMLAFGDTKLIDLSKISILVASTISAIAGFIWLYFSLLPVKGKQS
ncbi:MAG TPA: Na+/H+ antiporter NhaA [Chitinophagaceae bacterium]